MLGSPLRQKRARLGLSLRAAARRLGVSAAHLSRIERAIATPSEPLLRRAARLYACSKRELLPRPAPKPGPAQNVAGRRSGAATVPRQVPVAENGSPSGSRGSGLSVSKRGTRAIEGEFPFELLSAVAEAESWRKELARPIYHVHKWWAQRLGSVFRAALIGAAAPPGSAVMELFYQPVRLPGLVVFDPFMGSGTIVGEAHKLGCTAIGRDINPVAHRAVRVALGPVDRAQVEQAFCQLEGAVGAELRRLYRCRDSDGREADALYYFWVKVLSCPQCAASVDLFTRYVFATHAYRQRNPAARVCFPACSGVLLARHDAKRVSCNCGHTFDPQHGPARRTTAVCPSCAHEFPLAKTARSCGAPPRHRMYAKLVLRHDGKKEYLAITDEDRAAYDAAGKCLRAASPALHPRSRANRQPQRYGLFPRW